jgi:sigma-B regulation protein RsbU (phosphoserine phosphatase)
MTLTELLGGAIGSTLLALGAAAIVAWALHRRRDDRVLLFFGLWCSLYGARLIAEQPVIVAAIGGPDRAWAYFRAFITYVINVPIGLFLEALIGRGWQGSVRRVWQVQAAYAVGAIATDLVLGRPRAAMPLNSPMIVVALSLALPNVWMFRDRLSPTFNSPVIGAGAAALLVSVLNENLGRPVAPTVHFEPLGIFAFVVALGYGVVGSVFRREAELVAVQRELETARRIQAALLPRTVPTTPGLEVAARYVPMTAVAGDLYDFVRLGPSRLGILVADVSGHGVPAALVASMVKLAFTIQAEHGDDPARVLTSMNRLLCHQVESTFVTAIYAVVDTGNRAITVANAGHPSMLVGRSDRTVRESTERGLMLGLSPDASYANERLALAPGDRILLYTDGIPEAQSPAGEFLDVERIAEWVAATNGEDAARFAESMLRNLRQWRGTSGFDDDVTFVVARVAGTSGS